MGNTQTSYSSKGLENPLFFDLQQCLIQIKTLSEDRKKLHQNAKDIEKITKQALASIEYALFAMHCTQTQLPLTTFSAAAVASDVKSDLQQLAKTYNIDLCLEASKKLEPVYANAMAIKGSLYGLLSTMILSNPQAPKPSRPTITIAVQQTATTTQRLGVYSDDFEINLSTFMAPSNHGVRPRMVLPSSSAGSGLGLAVAAQLVGALDSNLQHFRHKKARGIGFYVPMSAQLSLLSIV
jgi:hypothetical protein